ncbi:MAG: hypothetical protein HYY43_06870 [Deltaproteobacteria bacterium]|nr:hypothetical protein [Deltaproteobacteria bacterium]
MKRLFLFSLASFLICAFSAKLLAEDTPPDPKFNSVEWYKCDFGKIKYKEGLAEKESGYRCVKTEKIDGSELNVAVNDDIGYYPVMSKEAADYFSSKGYKFQCDKNGGFTGGGILDGQFEKRYLAPPEKSGIDASDWVDAEYAKKGLVVFAPASVRAVDAVSSCEFKDQTCQFFSTQTNMRLGLFKTSLPKCGGKAAAAEGGSKGMGGLKGLFKKK